MRVAPAVVLLTLAAAALAGCVAPQAAPAPLQQADPAEDPLAGDAPALGPKADGLPNATLDVTWHEPTIGTVAVQASVHLDGAAPPDAAEPIVRFQWDDAPAETTTLQLDPSGRNATWAHHRDGTPGGHAFALQLSWGQAPPVASVQQNVTLHMPVTLILRADAEYAEDQNVFHATYTMPALPDETSALDLLDDASQTHGFPYDATYRSDLEAHYVHMVNDTKERWVVRELGISHSWMLLHEGATSGRAADHLYPQADDTVEFRFVRCFATGNCDGLED